MKRILTLDSARDSRLFDMLYVGFASAQPGARTVDSFRREAAILDKLDAASVEVPGPEPNTVRRALRDGVTRIEFSQAELEMVLAYIPTTAWTTRASREVVELLDRLGASERVG